MSWTALEEKKSLTTGIYTTRKIHLQDDRHDHGLEVVVTGTGTVAITPFTSISGKDWISGGQEVSGFGSVSGPGSNGTQIFPLLLNPSEFIKFEVNVAGNVEISLWFTQK